MKPASLKVCLLAALCLFGLSAADEAQSFTPTVRSIRVSAPGMGVRAISFESIRKAWAKAGADLDVERRLDSDEVVVAGRVIRSLYEQLGRMVQVDHSVRQIGSSSVEVEYCVTELGSPTQD